MEASKFLFEQDFGRRAASEAKNRADMEAARQKAFQEGIDKGRAQAEQQLPARLHDAMTKVVQQAALLMNRMDQQLIQMEEGAVLLSVELARKIAGKALEQQPLAALEETARRSFQHLRGVPHLVVRINPMLVEQAEDLMKPLAAEAGYEGRVVILGDPALLLGDASLEWADGGLSRSQSALRDDINQLLAVPFELETSCP